eukprot:8604241-Ditylum_brightwellii.AAC.1
MLLEADKIQAAKKTLKESRAGEGKESTTHKNEVSDIQAKTGRGELQQKRRIGHGHAKAKTGKGELQ